MNRQRLLELAGVIGVGSNMNNPSFEPMTGVPNSVEDPTGGQGSMGYAELGDSGTEDPISKMRAEAEKGKESPEAAMAAVENILLMLDEFDKLNTDEDEDDDEGEL